MAAKGESARDAVLDRGRFFRIFPQSPSRRRPLKRKEKQIVKLHRRGVNGEMAPLRHLLGLIRLPKYRRASIELVGEVTTRG